MTDELVLARKRLVWITIFLVIALLSCWYTLIMILKVCNTENNTDAIKILDEQKQLIFLASSFNAIASFVYTLNIMRYTFLMPVSFELVAVSSNIAFSFYVFILTIALMNGKTKWAVDRIKQDMLHLVVIYFIQVILICIYLITRWSILAA